MTVTLLAGRRLSRGLQGVAEAVAAALMATMFLVFILQIFIRYSGRLVWLGEAVPLLDPNRYGWTLEFSLMLWVWLVFWGGAFVVRESDHVRFDILLNRVHPPLRRAFVVITGLAIAAALLAAVEPTWAKFHILRLKKTATLSAVFGDWIRMRDIYMVYPMFLVVVAARQLWLVWRALRGELPAAEADPLGRRDE